MNYQEKIRETAAARPSTLANLRHGLRRTSKLGGASLLVLLAAPGYAQVSAAADVKAAAAVPAPATPGSASEDESIRPFSVHIPEETLVDLRQRLAEVRWPDRKPSLINRR